MTRTTLLSAICGAAFVLAGCGNTHSGGPTCGSTRCEPHQVCCPSGCAPEGSSCGGSDAGQPPDAGPFSPGDAAPYTCTVGSAECGAGYYCAPTAGCSLRGTCEVQPSDCTEEYAPVCGCDGQTYGNACGAASAAQGVSHIGECDAPIACGTRGGVMCAVDEFCYRDRDPHCGASDGGGTCISPPAACDANYDPVCSCDGVTYGNECEAQAARASVRYDGACEAESCSPQEASIVDPSCDTSAVYWTSGGCAMLDGCCEGADCGDGYESLLSCREAHRSCERFCGGWAGDTCFDDEFCDFSGPGCDWTDASGSCQPRPTECPEPGGVPVCGCNGQSYLTECSAHMAGTDSSNEGGSCPVPG